MNKKTGYLEANAVAHCGDSVASVIPSSVLRINNNIMPTVDKQSVRDEAARIKAEFDQLAMDKKFDMQTTMLFKSMLMLINLLISIFLEKT